MTFEHKKEGAQHANTKGSRNGPGDSVSATGDAQVRRVCFPPSVYLRLGIHCVSIVARVLT